jgi:hypothetical protein
MSKPTQRRRRRPKLCYHVIGLEIEWPGAGPDFHSLRVDCKGCQKLNDWLHNVWDDAKPVRKKK